MIYNPLKINDKHKTDLFHGVLTDLLTKDQTPKLINLAERESSYPEEEENVLNHANSCSPIWLSGSHSHTSLVSLSYCAIISILLRYYLYLIAPSAECL